MTSYHYNSKGRQDAVTDPKGIVTATVCDDFGRTAATINNYTGTFATLATITPSNINSLAVPSATANMLTKYSFDDDGHMIQRETDSNTTVEITKYIYGVKTTTAGGTSDISSRDLLYQVQYPDSLTDTYAYNEQGQVKTYKDRDGTVHTYSYDVLGRQTADAITTLGSGVDPSIQRIETAYDTQGNAYLFTSYNAASGGNIVNQVQQSFDGQDNMTAEYQAHSGAVNTAKTPVVKYGYSDPGTGKSRLMSMTYPDRSVVNYSYNDGLDDSISRLSSISFNGPMAESYTYLGISTVVQRSNPVVTLSYINGSNITGLDSFGRVTDQKWTTGTSTVTDEFGYTYDADSNRTKETNALHPAFNTTYTYDSFNQLSSSTCADGKDSESWSSDPLGNSTTVSGQSRGYNAQNEVTSVGGSSLAYDLNGNVITDEAGRKLTYDAWNRLVQVTATNCSCCCCNTTTVLAAYSYDALGRRIKEMHGSTTTDLYYSNQWQVLEETQGTTVITVTADNVWSPVYVDALVLVKQIPSCGPTQLLYVQQDANWNVTAVVNAAGVQQRFVYTPFGVQTVLQANFTASGSLAMIAYASQGLRLDSVIGDYDNRGRVKDPVLQRFLQGDPTQYNSGDSNFYRVEEDNPRNALDPSGLLNLKFWYRVFGDAAMPGAGGLVAEYLLPGTPPPIVGYDAIPADRVCTLVTDNRESGVSSYFWWRYKGDHESNISSPTHVAEYLESKFPDHGIDLLILAGHGSGGFGVSAQHGVNINQNMDIEIASRIAKKLSPNAQVVICSCFNDRAAGQDLADMLQATVIANNGWGHGDYGTKVWSKFSPNVRSRVNLRVQISAAMAAAPVGPPIGSLTQVAVEAGVAQADTFGAGVRNQFRDNNGS